jgi:hypothetical protein
VGRNNNDFSQGRWVQQEIAADVFRGTSSLKPSNVGSHFSADKTIAGWFGGRRGVVINAEIPISSMETDTATLKRKGVGDTQDWEGGPADEKEITARTGAPIKVKSVTRRGPLASTKSIEAARSAYNPNRTIDFYTDEENEAHSKLGARFHRARTRTYKKPREMTA